MLVKLKKIFGKPITSFDGFRNTAFIPTSDGEFETARVSFDEYQALHEVYWEMKEIPAIPDGFVDQHFWLVHSDGSECKDGCDKEAIPERLEVYRKEKNGGMVG